jgi:hypothetical protein
VRRFDCSINLQRCQARVVEKGLAGGGQRYAIDTARQKFGPDLVLQIANLPKPRPSAAPPISAMSCQPHSPFSNRGGP